MLRHLLDQRWYVKAVGVVVVFVVVVVVCIDGIVVIVVCEDEWFLPGIVRVVGVSTLLTLCIHLFDHLFGNSNNVCFVQRTFCHEVRRDVIAFCCFLVITHIMIEEAVGLSVCIFVVTT